MDQFWARLIRIGIEDKERMARKEQPDLSDVAPHLLNRQ